ncbi:histone H1-like [Aedes aegypti]|uniref:H15 domain-containing protein n=1 Tax=Aedes aegypti TaxID=7159 RepID=A0A903VAG5_AEDAE|nr:histone H1-like [Aedes aegypti]
MVVAAIKNLEGRNGSSLQAIKKYIAATTKRCRKLAPFLKKALKNGVEKGQLRGASEKKPKKAGEKKAKKAIRREEKATKKPAGEKKAKKPAGEKKAKKPAAAKKAKAAVPRLPKRPVV